MSTIKLNENQLIKLITECTKKVLGERFMLNEAFASKKLNDIFNKYGNPLGARGLRRELQYYQIPLSELTDNDVVGLFDPSQDERWKREGENDIYYAEKMGYKLGPHDKVISLPFNNMTLVVISRRGDSWDEDKNFYKTDYYDKKAAKHKVYGKDGAEEYQSINGASDVFNTYKNAGPTARANPVFRQNTIGNYLNYRKK